MAKEFEELRKKALESVKEKVRKSVSKDHMIINAISNVEELEKTINAFASRLRDWFSLKNPELERKIEDNEEFIKIVLASKDEPTLMGAEFEEEDVQAMKALAAIAQGMVETKTFLLLYLEKIMKEYCKNLYVLAGTTTAAKLIREAKSLKRLAELQSGTIQLFGAEKALFRHLKSGAKPPKYGFIISHPVVAKTPQKDKGKAARALADKISLAARLDYFKGEFMADKMLADLQNRFGQ